MFTLKGMRQSQASFQNQFALIDCINKETDLDKFDRPKHMYHVYRHVIDHWIYKQVLIAVCVHAYIYIYIYSGDQI